MSEQPHLEVVTIDEATSEISHNIPRELAENCTDSQVEDYLRS